MFSRKKSKSKSSRSEVDAALEEEILQTFHTFADEDDQEIMSLDGIGRLGEALDMDPSSDVRLLVLLWRLGSSQKPGCITKTEFVKGMKDIGASTVTDLINKSPSFDPGFLDKGDFRDFFRFVFQFSREGTHKTIEKEIVASLLPIVLDRNRAPHLEYFLQFLESCNHTVITLDQWDSFLQFQDSVGVDLAHYDDDGAWPLLLDEYVEWRREKSK
mmetsp:Transcript_12301/g.18639  ORF Transcript_12301/g.18639 Transcript_12301/m.18639 type:complete len:215 (-) Transcript_12301:151-795(-)